MSKTTVMLVTDNDGELITYQKTLPFHNWPQLLIWGNRFFVDYNIMSEGHRVYKEVKGVTATVDEILYKEPVG